MDAKIAKTYRIHQWVFQGQTDENNYLCSAY